MPFDPLAPLPWISANLPGVGGTIKNLPEDFVVEEIPLVTPCGEGEHLYLWIEKEKLSADAMMSQVARTLGISRGDIGSAGLKDTVAVTRQYLSVPARCENKIKNINNARLRVLKISRHSSKLRTGQLRGNRFCIRIRDTVPDTEAIAQSVIQAISDRGMPNFYGRQRFGRDGETFAIGLAVLRGERHPALARARGQRRGFLRRLAISSVQSALFNHCLEHRIRDGLLSRVLEGEVMLVRTTGGPFVVKDLEREQQRYDARAIAPGGPMFGPKMRAAQGEAAEREASVLEALGLQVDDFAAQGKLAFGTRRAMLIWPEDLHCRSVESDLVVNFALPAGSYATVLLDEIIKPAEKGAPPAYESEQ